VGATAVLLGVVRSALATVVPRLLLDAVVREPTVRYQPRVLGSAEALEAIDAGRLPLAIVARDAVPEGRDHAPIGSRRVAAVPDGGLLSLAEELSLETLAAHPVALGLDADPAAGDAADRLRRVVADGAVTVLPEAEARPMVGVAFRPIAGQVDAGLSLVWGPRADPLARAALVGAAAVWR
jgi:hypothetical protein